MKYILAIVMELQNRFPDVDNLDAFSIFDLQKLLSISDSDYDEFATYGQERLEYLENIYGDGANPDVDSTECTSEMPLAGSSPCIYIA